MRYQDEFFTGVIDGDYVFAGIARRGGHSTYRVKIPIIKIHDYIEANWKTLESLGCTYEGSSENEQRLCLIDIPPAVDVRKPYDLTEELEERGIWEFEEGHYYTRGLSKLTCDTEVDDE